MMCPTRPESPSPRQVPENLPPLNDATLTRAREGLEAARDRQVIDATDTALAELTDPNAPAPVSGGLRRQLLRVLTRGLFRIRVENAHRLPTEPALFVANHLNHIDPLLLLGELPAQPYPYVLGDARSLYNTGWKRALLRWAKGLIPLQRLWKEERAVLQGVESGELDGTEERALASAIREDVPDGRSIDTVRQLDRAVRQVFARGNSLLLFPEGRLGDREGQLQPLKRGTAIYALRSGVPVVPIALIGTKDLFFRKQLTVRVGEPLAVTPTKRPKSSQVRQLSAETAARLSDLLDVDYREPSGRKWFRHLLNHMFE